MTTIDDLLRQSFDRPSPAVGFTDRIIQTIAVHRERRTLVRLLTWAASTAPLFLLLGHFLSLVLIDAIGGAGRDLLSLLTVEPGLLLGSDGWGAIVESSFFANATFAVLAGVAIVLVLRQALRAWSMLPVTSHAL